MMNNILNKIKSKNKKFAYINNIIDNINYTNKVIIKIIKNITKDLININKILKNIIKIKNKSDSTNIQKTTNITNILNNNYTLIENIEGSNDYLKELLINQLKNICITQKLNYGDIKRISKFITSSIFNKDKCSIWNGYITNEIKNNKGTYINFYFKKKKIALHRLLYNNYIGELSNKEYIKFNCINKGKCCNIHHMSKYTYKDYFGFNETINNDKQGKVINITYQENDLSLII
jgi:hypothetical protein